jgi:hypothetical protein
MSRHRHPGIEHPSIEHPSIEHPSITIPVSTIPQIVEWQSMALCRFLLTGLIGTLRKGAQIVVGDDAVARAHCDAQHIGSVDGAAPERAHQDIPPSVQRFVWRRDGGRCRVDGCRSSRGIEVHHIVHRADGGTHEPLNLALLCSLCRARHKLHYAGFLVMPGSVAFSTVMRSIDPA